MAPLATSLILGLISLSFVVGQTIRPQIFGIDITFIDLLLPLLALTNFLLNYIKKTKISNKNFVWFLIIAWTTLLLNLLFNHYSPLRPFFYLIRLTSLISFFIYPLSSNIWSYRLLSMSIMANILFGLVQYFLWPDFTYFDALNWDPHLYRLVSTFFDPTFTALIYLIFLFQILNSRLPNSYKFTIASITYIAIALTYSRSTYLALLATSFIFSLVQKKYLVFIFTLILISLTIVLLPRHPGEGSKLERTSSIYAKVENYKLAFRTITKSPVIGFGYNTLSQLSNYPANSHAANGFDSSLLTIWATTGIAGLFFFIKGLITHLKKTSMVINIAFFAVLVHSLFANSLLYPWVLFYLAFLSAKYHK